MQNKKIALVADWIYGGGAEKVLEQAHKIFPDAPIYTSYCSDEWRTKLDDKVVTGYLQNWPFNKLRKFLPLLRQWWFAGLNLDDFNIVISFSGNGESKFIKTSGTHICYCHTPPHFYWRKYRQYLKNPGFGKLNFLARFGLRLLVKPLRNRDYKASQKVDYFIANSTHISRDIKEYYGRESTVIFPPVDTQNFAKVKLKSNRKGFILWGRHVPDKRIDIAIEACNNLKLPLTVVGEGVETQNLKKLAGPTIKFTGFVSDEELIEQISSAEAFIFTSEEDFGIAPVEALASGLPVIAYKAGGALDYVIEGKTGTFFDEQTPESLQRVLKAFEPKKYSSGELQKSAEKFSADKFTKELISFVSSLPLEEK